MDKSIAKKEKSKARKIIKWISNIIVLILFVSIIIVFTQLFTGKEPSFFGYKFYIVATQSMEPTLNKGDVLISKTVKNPKELKKGDIITFIAPEGFSNIDAIIGQKITHRIITAPYQDPQDGKWYVNTQGDNTTTNPTPDRTPIPLENISSVLVKNATYLRAFINFLSKWYGFVLLVVLPLLTVLAIEIRNLYKHKIQCMQEKENQAIKLAVEEAVNQAQQANSTLSDNISTINDNENCPQLVNDTSDSKTLPDNNK